MEVNSNNTMTIYTFNKTGYDPFIDFIKAYAIICVLIGHTFPSLELMGYGLWAGMQVPLFVLIQSFHSLKKENNTFQLKKIIWRIFVPFVLVEMAIFSFLLIVHPSIYTVQGLTSEYIAGGGMGPGSYFPWVYFQIAIILPLFGIMIRKYSKIQLAFIFLLICEGMEILCSVIDLPDKIYRLLCLRYIFLFFLAWIWVKDGIEINTKTILLSLVSFLSAIYFSYYSINDEPWFYNTSWALHRWPCYYYVAIALVGGLYYVFKWLSKVEMFNKTIKLLAKCSYEIFLTQMAVCTICPSFDFIPNNMIRISFRIILIFAISIIGGYYFNMIYSRFMERYVR